MNSSNTHNLFFGGTAYLGMPFNESFRKLVFKGMELYGINHGASRNNNITLDIFSLAEKEAAKRYLSEDAIIVSSGYLAAQMVIQHYYQSHHLIYAPESHPALFLGIPNSPKQSYKDWIEHTVNEVNSSKKPVLIISNALNNLIPEIYDFEWLSRLVPDREIIILIDDSHSLGVVGENGEGSYSQIPNLPSIQKIVVSSMAKAMGVDAGLILADSLIINSLRGSAIYAGSSPPSPGILYAYVHSEEIYHHELKHLRQNIKLLADLIDSEKELFYVKDFPVFLIKNEKIAEGLIKRGIQFSSFPYPDPKGNKLNRLVISSIHKAEEINLLANLIKELDASCS